MNEDEYHVYFVTALVIVLVFAGVQFAIAGMVIDAFTDSILSLGAYAVAITILLEVMAIIDDGWARRLFQSVGAFRDTSTLREDAEKVFASNEPKTMADKMTEATD